MIDIIRLRTEYYRLGTAIVGRGESTETFIAGSVLELHDEQAMSQLLPQEIYAPRY
jgi:hypothetical protein